MQTPFPHLVSQPPLLLLLGRVLAVGLRWQSPGARLAKLQDAFVTNSGARSDAEADAAVERFVRERVAFLGPDLVRRREVGLAAVCAGGGRLSKRFDEKYNKK